MASTTAQHTLLHAPRTPSACAMRLADLSCCAVDYATLQATKWHWMYTRLTSDEEASSMELAKALKFSYTSVAQEMVCDTDAIAGLCGTLDRLGANNAMIVCGPSILRGSDVIKRVQEVLGARCVGLFAGVAP